VHGRGATDIKGGCASILAACETLVNRNQEVPVPLAFVCDEETGGENGIRRLLADHALTPCDYVIAEPTPSRHPCIGQKGLCRLDMEFSGTPAHGSLYPAVGTSAIMEVVPLLNNVKELNKTEFPVDPSLNEIITQSSAVLGREFGIAGVRDILKRLTFNPGIIRGERNPAWLHSIAHSNWNSGFRGDVSFRHSPPQYRHMPFAEKLFPRKPTILRLPIQPLRWLL
jgi:succinyl-diaminopimelate desuccinylase